jgi:signal transduction histidine kinase/CheY-like chemotaxis protein
MAAEANAESALRSQIRAEQIAILFRHLPLTLVTNVLLASGVVWVLWDIADHEHLVAWLTVIVLLAGVRFGIVLGYRHKRHAVPWHTCLTIVTLFGGAAWGAAGVLFFIPDSSMALIFVTIVLASISAGAVPAYSSWMPAQYSVIPTTLPISLRYLAEGGDFLIMGVMSLLFLVNVLAAARRLSNVLVASIRLGLEKQELAQRLREEMRVSEQSRSHAEEANRSKSKFLAAASHDLRQPLHAANLFLEALRRESEPARALQLLDHLETSTHALEDMLHELLDISKLEAGLFQPQLRVFALQELFIGLERELRPVAEANGVELGFITTRLRVHSDPQMLGRILRNIITNAIRHTGRGAVLVGCRRKGERVAVAVCDTGPGIAPEHHRAIFKEFYQLENPERDRRKGLGLGLAIVDGLCRVLQHPLKLQSRVGRGSTFSVHVPIVRGLDAAVTAIEAPATPDMRGYAVLIIDDEAAVRQATERVLMTWGCRVLTAESADDALEQLRIRPMVPDAIIADYRLRQETGVQAITRIRQALGLAVPATLLTGDTAPERLREAKASGLLLLHKPLQPARLRAALFHLCSENLNPPGDRTDRREDDPSGTSAQCG